MRVIILGAGYAGLTLTRRLERVLPDEVEVVLVDEDGTHLVKHELHRVIRRPELEDAISIPLEEIVRSAEIREQRVTDIDTTSKEVTLDGAETLAYDLCAICLGADTAFYGLDAVEDIATPLQSIDDAREIRTAAMTAIDGHAVVGGGGLTGIQVAGELAALSDEQDLDLDVTLVEQAAHVAPPFDATFANAIAAELEDRGVTVETETRVESATEETVDLADGRSLPADLFVWAGGIAGPEPLDGERHPVEGDLQVADGTFVVGDAGDVTDVEGTPVPASAQTAVQQARLVARNMRQLATETDDAAESTSISIPVAAEDEEDAVSSTGDQLAASDDDSPPVADREVEAYTMDIPGWVVSVGDGAVAKVGNVVINGDPARLTKAIIGAGHLGSIGAIEEASELVAEELNWPTASTSLPVDSAQLAKLPTDPSTPSTVQYPVANMLDAVLNIYPTGETIDLTTYTSELDTTRPGSTIQLFQQSVFDGVNSVLSAGQLATPDEEEADDESTPVSIDVTGEPGTDEPQEGADGEDTSTDDAGDSTPADAEDDS